MKGRWSRFEEWRSGLGGGRVRTCELPPVAIVGLGNASAGHGSIISRRISASVASFTSFFRREYTSGPVTRRGLGTNLSDPASGCRMYLVSVDEYNTSQTCSRCFVRGLREARINGQGVYSLKVCPHGAVPQGGSRQPQQQHVGVELFLDRDRCAARMIVTKLMFLVFPPWMVDNEHRQQAAVFHRHAP